MGTAQDILWDIPPKDTDLLPGEVHVWGFPLEQESVAESVLSSQEISRATAFAFDVHRRRYIAAHTATRCILSNYVQVDPAKLVFDETARGKPSLSLQGGRKPVYFNLSHSESIGLLAVTCVAEIGVDIEFVRPIPDMISIAHRFFCPAEREKLVSLPPNQQKTAFFNCWTRKEACLKATGDGIANFLSSTEVTLVPQESVQVLKMAGSPQEASNWILESFSPAFGYVAAMAVRTSDLCCRCWRWLL